MRRFTIGIGIFAASFVLTAESRGQGGPPSRRSNESDQSFGRRNSFWEIDQAERARDADRNSRRPNNAIPSRRRSDSTQSKARPKATQPRPTSRQVLSDREYFAPNLKIHFKLVRVGGAAGAQLTRDPASDAPVSRIWVNNAPIRLEADDVIYNLDDLPVREAVDVMNHHARTTVSFIDHRTQKTLGGVVALPPYTPLPDDVPQERHAPSLGLHYQLFPLGEGSFGARLSRTASPGTPAGAIGLERGDIIVKINGESIHGSEDVSKHVSSASLEFVNIRTGQRQLKSAY